MGDSKSIRTQFQDAMAAQTPLMDRIQLDTMCTVVDASMWESYFTSTKQARRSEMSQLYNSGRMESPPQPPQQEEEWDEGYATGIVKSSRG